MKGFLAAIIFALGMAPSLATPPDSPARDYSHITSREAAEALAAKGQLFKVLLFPEEFGGESTAMNVVYVPAGIPEEKDRITGTLVRFFEEGLIDRLTVTPEYKGKSVVPSRIVFEATYSSRDSRFEPVIDIW